MSLRRYDQKCWQYRALPTAAPFSGSLFQRLSTMLFLDNILYKTIQDSLLPLEEKDIF